MIWILGVYVLVLVALLCTIPKMAYRSKTAYDRDGEAVSAAFACFIWPVTAVAIVFLTMCYAVLWVTVSEFRNRSH